MGSSGHRCKRPTLIFSLQARLEGVSVGGVFLSAQKNSSALCAKNRKNFVTNRLTFDNIKFTDPVLS